MPIPPNTRLTEIPSMLAQKIATYNASSRTAAYNHQYRDFISARKAGIVTAGSLAAWISMGEAAQSMQKLLRSFGLGSRNSKLASARDFENALARISPDAINWISGISLPLVAAPPSLVNPATGATLSGEIEAAYCALSARGAVTDSGGFVAASKTMHCLFPELLALDPTPGTTGVPRIIDKCLW
jgi:hypothetical protein